MAIEKLTAARVARISKPGKYSDGNGLYLYVSKNLVKSWVFRFQIDGAEHYMGLGPLHAVNIQEAREEARKARACLVRKINPLRERVTVNIEKKDSNIRNKTFDDCALTYIALHKHEWRNMKHLKQWESSLRTYASPYFGKMLVREITTEHVLQALEPIWVIKTETAHRLRERIERILSWATVCGCREGENPARWNGHMQELLPKPSRIKTIRHHPSMSYQEIGEFFRLLNIQIGIGARALEFTILTACRTSEALYARWQEIDFDRRIWTIPPERIKSGRQHRVPLSEAALEILHALEGLHPDYVFANLKSADPCRESLMSDQLKKMNRHDVTVHGFRSTFRVWAAERGYPRELAEMALAHKQATAVEEAYQRSDLFERRRALMRDWSDWCMRDKSCSHPFPDWEECWLSR